MKPKYSILSVGLAMCASFSLVSNASAASLQEIYGFSTPGVLETYALPVGITNADIDTSFTVSASGFTPFTVGPVLGTSDIQRIFVGTVAAPTAAEVLTETEISDADLGITFSGGPPASTGEHSLASTTFDLAGYTYISIYNDYTVTGTPVFLGGSGTLEIDALEAPEPSTWALMLGGLGLLGFIIVRRNRSALV